MLAQAALAGAPVIVAAVPVAPVIPATSSPSTRQAGSEERDLARQLVAAGKLGDARFHFQAALKVDPNNADLWIEYGDLLYRYSVQDPTTIEPASSAWERALQDRPKDLSVLARIEAAERRAVDFYSSKEHIGRLRDLSQRVLAVDAKNIRAQTDGNIATVAGWLQGFESGGPEVTRAVTALAKLRAADPTDSDIPYYAGSAYVRQATEAASARNEAGQTAARISDAVTVFEDALRDRPNDLPLILRYSQVLRAAQRVVGTPGHEEAGKKYDAILRELLTGARTAAKPDQLGYTEFCVALAESFLRNGEAAEGEKVLRDLVRQRPGDQSARVALASVLFTVPDKRPQAIDLLKQEITDTGQVGVTQFWSHATLEMQTELDLTKDLIEQSYATTDPAIRKALRVDLDKSFDFITARAPQHPETLKLKAKILLLPGGIDASLAAIPVIEKAISVTNTINGGNTDVRTDWDLQFMLARCYVDTQQTGEARKILWKVTEGVPGFAPAHLLLAQLLLESKETDLAAEQLKTLQKLSPQDPTVKRLDLALLMVTGKRQELLARLKEMPESTTAEKKLKVQLALASDTSDEAQRLLVDLNNESPGDFDVVDALARLYWKLGEKQKATDLVTSAAKAAPNNAGLKILLSQFHGDKAETIQAETAAAIAADPDPLSRELKLFDLYATTNAGEALKHLDAAESINPNNLRVLDVRFQLALNAKSWDQARRYTAKLTEQNADQAHGLIYSFRLAMAQGDLDEAGNVAEDLVKTLPQYARSWLSKANVLQARGKFDAAIAAYSAALERQSENIEALRGLIECHDALHHADEVKRYLDRSLELRPDDAAFREQRLQWDLVYGNPADAVKGAAARRDAAPASLDVWLRLGATCMQAARQSVQTGHTPEAQAYSKQARETFTEAVKKWPDEKLPYAYLADLAEFTGDFADGESALKALAARDAFKNSADPLLLLADYELRQNKPTEAEAALVEAVNRSHGDAGVHIKLARFYSGRKEFEKALAQLDENSADIQIPRQRIETLVAAGRADDAKKLLDKLTSAQPKDISLKVIRSWLMLNANQLKEARAAAEAVLDTEPKNSQALFFLGQTALRELPPKYDEAIRVLSAARDLVPTNISYHQYLAEAYRLSGDGANLASELATIVRLEPLNRFIRSKLVETYITLPAPRWDDALQVLAATKSIPQLAGDPEWPNMAAGIWRARNEPLQATEKARETLALAAKLPPDQITRAISARQNALAVLRWAKQNLLLLEICGELLKDPALKQSSWWIYSFRGAANHTLAHEDEARHDFENALQAADTITQGEVRIAAVNDLVEVLGIDTAIEMVAKRVTAGDPRWRISLASLYLRKTDLAKATSTIEQVLVDRAKLSPAELVASLDIAGATYMQSKNYGKATETYDQLIAVRPDDISALNNLACLYGELHPPLQLDKALACSQRALELASKAGPPDPNLLDTYGWMLVLNGRNDEGVKLLQAAVARQPFAEGYYHLGIGLRASGSANASVVAFLKAKELAEQAKVNGHSVSSDLEEKIGTALAVLSNFDKPAKP